MQLAIVPPSKGSWFDALEPQVPVACDGADTAAAARETGPRFDIEPLTWSELIAWFRGGERQADDCEKALASMARLRGSLEVAIAEGLHALKRGDRLAQLGYHLDDYAREVLDIAETTTRRLARVGGELRHRPLLRDALRAGRVGIRAAETVLAVAIGDAEAEWVARAGLQTVRELEVAVRRARAGDADEEDDWVRLRANLPDLEREVLEAGLAAAVQVEPGLSRAEQFEALAQEYLGGHGTQEDVDDTGPLGGQVQPLGQRARRDAQRRAQLEAETDRWAMLPAVEGMAVPEVQLDDLSTAREIDAELRRLAAARVACEDVIGWCAHAIRRSGMPGLLGFTSFRHYVEERLGLSPRSVEQREALEKRLWASPALRDARRQGVSYEKLRALSRLPDRDVPEWTPRALTLTCIELRRQIDGERSRQLRAARRLVVSMPRRIAVALAAAVHAVREREGRLLPIGKCLSFIGEHFLDTWKPHLHAPRTRSEKVRARDQGLCQVPGCSHRADHAHHVQYRSRGGGDELVNQIAICSFHHLRCIHQGHLRVVGEAPGALRWFLHGEPFDGVGACSATVPVAA